MKTPPDSAAQMSCRAPWGPLSPWMVEESISSRAIRGPSELAMTTSCLGPTSSKRGDLYRCVKSTRAPAPAIVTLTSVASTTSPGWIIVWRSAIHTRRPYCAV